MSAMSTIVCAVAALAWAMVAWDLGKKWIADHSAFALHKRQADWEAAHVKEHDALRDRCEVNKRAIENLAKEMSEEVTTLRAQQVGVLSGMGQGQRARGNFR